MTEETLRDLAEQQQEERERQLERTRLELAQSLQNRAGLDRLSAISVEEWEEAQAADQEAQEQGTAPLPFGAGLGDHERHVLIAAVFAALNWQPIVDGMSNVQRLVHLAMRRDAYDQEQTRTELMRVARRAFEEELTMQAARVGCPGRSGILRNGPILSQLNDVMSQHAASITNTYNFDLAVQITKIRQDVPRANRHTYAKRLLEWDKAHAEFKSGQIAMMTEATARSLAQETFFQHNGHGGYAVLMPTTAVCPVCQGWIDRGKVPLAQAEAHPPPYHCNCPHHWMTFPDQRTPEECQLLWMGS